MDGQSPEISGMIAPEKKDKRPITSNNRRVESVYQNSPELANREYTLPCISRPVYQDQTVLDNPDLAHRIAGLSRVIITPSTYEQLSDEQKAQVQVLASPYECGRVLEADDKVEIDGDKYVLSIKGVGSTEFARTTGAENPWMFLHQRSFTSDDAEKLKLFPFLVTDGVMTADAAFTEVEGSRAFQAEGIDTEHVLAIHEILEMPDEHGVLRPISYFQEHGVITSEDAPVLVFRGVKSNYRLLDPVMLETLKKHNATADFLQHALDEYGQTEHVANPTFENYIQWLSKKVIQQELPMIVNGYKMSSYYWQDLARNISIAGEELDLEDVKVDDYIFDHPYDYYGHIRNHFGNTETALRSYIDVLYPYTNKGIDFEAYGNDLWDTINTTLDEIDFAPTHARLQQSGRFDSSLDEHKRNVRHNIKGHFKDNVLIGDNYEEIKKYQDIVEKRIAAERHEEH